MSQTVHYWMDNVPVARELPDACADVLPGVRWGEPWTIFTPAYWISQLWMSGLDSVAAAPFRAHGTLAEELVFCLLGGYGITAELATAAFQACCDAGLINRRERSASVWTRVLQAPLYVQGRVQHYRYPQQKARFLAGAMDFLEDHAIETPCGRVLRDALLGIKGVGPKTAGWIARNYLDADDVAILDIHLIRAGLLCDLFAPEQRVERDYFAMEARFIDFCRALGVRPAVLDCLIWGQMRNIGRVALDALRWKLDGRVVMSRGTLPVL